MPDPLWPVLKTYRDRNLDRIALPLGGIGTGTVSLGGRGDLRDWEIVNRPAKGWRTDTGFFAIRTATEGGPAAVHVLEGQLPPDQYEGAEGSPTPRAGLPRFASAEFAAAYPLGQVTLTDPDLPVTVRLEAFNPLLPNDPEASGLPVAVLRYRVRNAGSRPVEVSICGSLRNFIGTDGHEGAPRGNVNTVRTGAGCTAIHLRTTGVPETDERYGDLTLAVLRTENVTHRTGWEQTSWGNSLLDFWDDFSADGILEDRHDSGDAPIASLAAGELLAPGAETTFTFLLSWRFPNRRAWYFAGPGPRGGYTDDIVGNHYAQVHRDSWEVVRAVVPRLPALESATVDFVEAVCSCTLPEVYREAALFNLSTLRTQTCFRTADGRFYGWEGVLDDVGSCMGSCTHVWNYELATPYLFGSLARSMREIEFGHATDERGHMSFRVGLPLQAKAKDWALAAADGQMGCIVKLYREWRLSGDEDFLRSLWPAARRALEFCWIPGGWDADADGVMEGAQHNTMDIEYYGPNPHMACWYLAALRAAERMAEHLGEREFAGKCRRLHRHGSAWVDEHLFNGEYYEHRVAAPGDFSAVAPGLRADTEDDPGDPALQLGAGCAIDQLSGQYVASAAGLGDLLEPAHIHSAIAALMRHNHHASFRHHFNHMRSYVLGDESGVVMASYPRSRPAKPFPYYNEVMTGFEYGLAINAIYQGDPATAEQIVTAIRARYDGQKRNPFDEAECGHHYARAMASWGLLVAATGFSYDAVVGSMTFAAADSPVRWVWSVAGAWGECIQGDGAATVLVRSGAIAIRQLRIGVTGRVLDEPLLRAGDRLSLSLPAGGQRA